jgi:hypothetical protein
MISMFMCVRWLPLMLKRAMREVPVVVESWGNGIKVQQQVVTVMKTTFVG